MKQTLPLLIALLAASMPTHAIEEPAYEVIRTMGDVELRQYAPYVVAEVVRTGSAPEAGNKAFPILAGRILRRNEIWPQLPDDASTKPH